MLTSFNGTESHCGRMRIQAVFSPVPRSPGLIIYLHPARLVKLINWTVWDKGGNFYQLWPWLTHREEFGEIKKGCRALSPPSQDEAPRGFCREMKFFQISRWRHIEMKRLEPVGVCHLLRDGNERGAGGVGESGVNVGSLLSAVHQSAVQAKWDRRYEEGRNYSADMMRDPGVMLSRHHHLHSARRGL